MGSESLYEIIMRAAEESGVSVDVASGIADAAVEMYKAENLDAGAQAGQRGQALDRDLRPELMRLSSHEVEKFVRYAKEQGTKMSFGAMESGILSAGRKDMRDGLAEILNSMEFAKQARADGDRTFENRGRSKKKVLTGVGEIEVNPERLKDKSNEGDVYPLLDFMGLIRHEVPLADGSAEILTIKCTRYAAASIALACSESSYGQATLMLDRLAGMDVSVMTAFRATDSVGTEFVRDVPEEIELNKIEELTKKLSGNALETRLCELESSEDRGEVIRKALEDRPDGVLYKDYDGPKMKVMFVQSDGINVPGLRKELTGAKGRQPDGSAKTFESKIGAVFIVEYTADGKPLLKENGEIYRDGEVLYMGTVRKAEDFGPMLFRHAIENGLEDADAVVFLGDGSKWIWNSQSTYFPFALCGLDLYHAIEHVNEMVDLLRSTWFGNAKKKQAFKDECIELLRHGDIQAMLDRVASLPILKSNEEKFEKATGYFQANMERMNYGAFQACGIYVGSGVIEAGCKIIVSNRMKNAGMHWSKDHTEKMINIRCAIRNGTFFDQYLGEHAAPAAKFAA